MLSLWKYDARNPMTSKWNQFRVLPSRRLLFRKRRKTCTWRTDIKIKRAAVHSRRRRDKPGLGSWGAVMTRDWGENATSEKTCGEVDQRRQDWEQHVPSKVLEEPRGEPLGRVCAQGRGERLGWGRQEGDRLAARRVGKGRAGLPAPVLWGVDRPSVSWSGEPGWGELLGRDGAASGARVGRRCSCRTHRAGMRGARCPGAQGAGARRHRGESWVHKAGFTCVASHHHDSLEWFQCGKEERFSFTTEAYFFL